jgi:type VI secretion system protein ImpL
VIYILFGLLAALAWALWFILQWPLLIPLIATAVLAVIAIGVFVWLTIRGRRKAAALEKALAAQGMQQAMNVPPEKRQEIQALQKQILDGVNALKSSKLGGKKRGAAALYALPWYAIVGPPGAGKTTALRHSGLVFPYADSAVRGVGGTRNCDWWFTNDAILLDTAGRYATESEDQGEWLAFLDMLRKYRGNKPLNGLIVAVSITDVIDANEQQLEMMARKLRGRIDEVMTRLRMVLPVYVLLTKCDLIAGFNEFFGAMRKSERAQAWGATVALREDKQNPGAIFVREFDLLVEEIHKRALRRQAQERNRQAREAIFQFPIEFAAIKRNLHDLVAQVFQVNAFQGTPLFRGFYFSSGTQEGTPLSRVLQRMGQAMGIGGYRAQAAQQQVESKSYFLHDVFMKVVFPDADVAGRSASELRRQRLLRMGVGAVALAVAVTFAVPSVVSFFNNKDLVADSVKRAKAASKIEWDNQSIALPAKLDELDPLLTRLKELDQHEAEGVPFGYRFLMYSGETIYRSLVRVYVANMQQGFVKTTKYYLEQKLREFKGEDYYLERRLLKTYLLLSEVDHLADAPCGLADLFGGGDDDDQIQSCREWAIGQYTAIWAETQKATSPIALVDLKKRMLPHVRYYFELISPIEGEKPRATPVEPNAKVVDQARKVLIAVPVNKRYYSLFVDSLNHELRDPTGDNIRANHRYPAVTLGDMFADRQHVLKFLRSKQQLGTKRYYEVPGPYTNKGRYAVTANIGNAAQLLDREQWVVPLSEDERGDKVAVNVKRTADDYEEKYIQAWQGFLLDIDVLPPANLKEAVDMYALLQEPEWPFVRIIRNIEDHTQWDAGTSSNKALTSALNRKLNAIAGQQTKGLKWNLDVNKLGARANRVPAHFKSTVGFGVPDAGSKAPTTTTPLSQYMDILARVRKVMVEAIDRQPDADVNIVSRDLQQAMAEVEKQLQPRDDMAKRTLLPMLSPPLNVAGKIKQPTALGLN